MEQFNFKKPKSIDEMIEHLKSNKNIVFKNMSTDEAKTVLYQNNYINVITPFKYNFAKKHEGQITKDPNNNHIYERQVDFKEYYDLYIKEREIYPCLYSSLTKFETCFNSILSYHIMNHHNLDCDVAFDSFISGLLINISLSDEKPKSKAYYIKTINDIRTNLSKYGSIFILLDRLHLSELLVIFKFSESSIKNSVFKELLSNNLTFNTNSIYKLEDIMPKVISIRNCVFHCNSLEILKRYHDPKKHDLRSRTQYRIYSNLIQLLSK